jgi:hypothetical protein
MSSENNAPEQVIIEREKAREIIDKVKESSQNDYEKNIIYITAGTLVLSITFIEKISPLSTAVHIWMIVTSWSFLVFSLGINLLSHWYSAFLATKIQKMLNSLSIPATVINERIDWFNRRMQVLNIGTFTSMFIGLFFLVLYCSNNAYHMSNLENKDGQPANTDTIQKGRVFSPISDYTPAATAPTQTAEQPAQASTPAASTPTAPPETSGN